MSVPKEQYVTKEDILNSYEFKIIKRILKEKFPWIINVVLPNKSEVELNKYQSILIRIVMNPYLFAEMNNTNISPFALYALKTEDYVTFMLSIPFDMSYDDARAIENNINNVMLAIRKSPVIPDELKLKFKNRIYGVGDFKFPSVEKLPPPENVKFPEI